MNSPFVDNCKCGQPGCLGHERKTDASGNGRVVVPGFTTQQELSACKDEIVVFDNPFKPHVLKSILEKLTVPSDVA